jgi:lipid-A-disaccharide synthase
MSAPRIFTVAAEPSGDLLALEVITVIRQKQPDAIFEGIGGEETEKAGIISPIDVSPLSVFGMLAGLKIYGTVIKLADAAVDAIIAFDPDIVVLIDSWGFMVRVAERLRKRAPQIKIVKLVGPQVWATRPGRAKTMARLVDHMICIHAMEAPYYESLGLPVTVMGNPALSRAQPGNPAALHAATGLAPDQPILLVLPGSRQSEIELTAPALVEAARLIKAARSDITVVFAPAPSVRDAFTARFPNSGLIGLTAPRHVDRYDIMASADYALACSGTVTSELAVQGVPFLVGYRAGWFTYFLVRKFLYKLVHVTLLNIAADDTAIVPEFVQDELNPEAMAKTALAILNDPEARVAQLAAQEKALSRMGEGDQNAPDIAAEAILSVLSAP